MEENQGSSSKKIYIIIIVLLLLVNGFGGYMLWNDNKIKKDLTDQRTKLEGEYKSLTDTLEMKKAEIDQMIQNGNIQDSTIMAQRAELEEKEKQIKSLFAKDRLDKKQLDELRNQIAAYQASIGEMQKRIDELTAQNQQLTAANQQLTTDLNSEKATTSQLAEQNKGLSAKVELGSLLQLRNMEVVGIKKKGGSKETVVKKAKQTESIRITFETGDNKVLDPGPLSLYVRIINPKGETISVADQGSGTFKMAGTNDATQFTKKADLDWDQSNKKVVIYWSQNVQTPGDYKVEVYQSGMLVGEGRVELK